MHACVWQVISSSQLKANMSCLVGPSHLLGLSPVEVVLYDARGNSDWREMQAEKEIGWNGPFPFYLTLALEPRCQLLSFSFSFIHSHYFYPTAYKPSHTHGLMGTLARSYGHSRTHYFLLSFFYSFSIAQTHKFRQRQKILSPTNFHLLSVSIIQPLHLPPSPHSRTLIR